jgi:hypothetical protein
MPIEGARPPPFYCPSCGKKHRADLSALAGRTGAHAKVTCQRCEIVMTISLGADGLPKCEALETPAAIDSASPSPAPQATADTADPGGTMSRTRPALLLATAAVVAGVVSFLMVSFAGGGPAEAGAEAARIDELSQAVEDLRKQLAERGGNRSHWKEASEDAAARIRTLEARVAAVEKATAGNGSGVESLGTLFATANASFEKLRKDYTSLHGRIEANYQRSRAIEKRLEALEGE